MADNSLVILLTNPWVLGVVAVLVIACVKDMGKRQREVAEYEADPVRYRELQRQGLRR